MCVAILSGEFNENERNEWRNEAMELTIDINFGIGKVFVTESDYDTLYYKLCRKIKQIQTRSQARQSRPRIARPSLNEKKKGYNNVMAVSC